MKLNKYKLFILLAQSQQGVVIEQANCGCPAGKGPRGTCKHIAALAYAVEDFTKKLIKD
jgi:predicted nucleic acid-binding Zn finger protein